MMLSQEDLYQAIQQENWKYILDLLHKQKTEIKADVLLSHSANVFVNEFLRSVPNYPNTKNNLIELLETLFLLHNGNFYNLSTDQVTILKTQLAIRKASTSIKDAYPYAKDLPYIAECKAIIDEYNRELPRKVSHSQESTIQVTEQSIIEPTDFTINLFKSSQEIDFFLALTKTFSAYQIYPNVALSCLFNWNLLKDKLNNEEQSFFFKGIIDFVVFDQAEGYKPVYFFELDSIYHDSEKQKNNDKIKNDILSKAGVKLLRIRKMNKHVTDSEFIKMIREVIK